MKSFLFKIIFLLVLFFSFISGASANEDRLDLYFFYGEGCPHCAKEKSFLFEEIKKEFPAVNIFEYEIYKNRENAIFLQEAAKKLRVNVEGVPFLIIGDEAFTGFTVGFSDLAIRNKVVDCLSSGCLNLLQEENNKVELNESPATVMEGKSSFSEGNIIDLPFLGKIDFRQLSLPVLTIVVGVLDGFNPCAMWALLFLITLLLGMKNKRRMWLLGTVFIVTSAVVYFIFMVAWLKFVLFLGVVSWLRIMIGVVALFGGGYSLKEAIFNKETGCKITGTKKRQVVFEKIKNIVREKSLFLGLLAG